MSVKPLKAEQLYTKCPLDDLNFKTTLDLSDLDQPLGQERAIEAINFCINVDSYGYNLFCIGPEGTGKASLVKHLLTKAAKERKTPDDWCYIYNFETPYKPAALRLPAGKARPLAKDVDKLIEELKVALPATFESDEYKTALKAIEDKFKDQKTKYFDDIQKNSTGKNVSILRMPVGLVVAPTRDGEVLSPEAFEKLDEEEQREILAELNTAQEELEEAVRDIPQWEKDQREEVRKLNEQFAELAIKHLIDDLRKKYRHTKNVPAFLKGIYNDIIENVALFISSEESSPSEELASEDSEESAEDYQLMALLAKKKGDSPLKRYKVNVLVDHTNQKGAPLIFLDHPIITNLFGRVDRQQQFGALVTDFNMIKAGALHDANGGFLVLEAKDILSHPSSWEALKRALRAKKITMDPPTSDGGMTTTILEPEAIPLNIKVVLLGDPNLYYTLVENDPDFEELFRVEANFFPTMDKKAENIEKYARLISTQAKKNKLRPLTKEAVERLIEHASRLAEDVKKLSTHIASINDLIREANYCALLAKSKIITSEHIEQAIKAKIYRSDRISERMEEQIERGSILIDTQGEVVGQINGLAVFEFGHVSFGKPSKITCLTRLGNHGVIDIEREVDLGGSLHSKGVLILSSFIANRYSKNAPLSMNATLVFEQSYGEIDGDSASSTELYVILSALSGIPIKQNLAVTGSVNQFGQIQAIGGVNEKIEGFFDICKSRGLTGTQGVLIPYTNIENLMLKKEVVEACAKGKFHIYPVKTIDEGIEILTGVPAGKLDKNGKYPANSVNGKVQKAIDNYLAYSLEYKRQANLTANIKPILPNE
ncbi:MAG: AAA family ATPase [Alphaproteobacteria bacterium]|nr:AAA family ATPase [Alphaproteobacteria bacterium]